MQTSPTGSQTPTERRAAEAAARAIIEKHAPDHASLVAAVRRRLRKLLPTAQELVYEYRAWFAISYSPSEHGYEGVVGIRGSAEDVRLCLNCHKPLPDPEKLLRGSGKLTRWLPLEAAADLSRPAIVRLIEAALAANPKPFAPSGRGPIVVRS